MNTETSAQVAQLMARIFGLADPALAQGVTRDDGGCWDSLRHMELIFAVEDAFGIQFAEADIAGIRRHGELVARIDALRAASSLAP